MKIEVIEYGGLKASMRAMRKPLKSGEKSDSGPFCRNDCANCDAHAIYGTSYERCEEKYPDRFVIGPNDHALSMRLIHAGSDDRKHIRQIIVWFEIDAPLYWWSEFDTYRIGVEKESESTMHTLLKSEIISESFDFDEWMDEEGNLPDWTTGFVEDLERHRKTATKRGIKQLLPCGYRQGRVVMASYEALRNMYQARKNHELKEWREFCRVLEKLPYAEFIDA